MILSTEDFIPDQEWAAYAAELLASLEDEEVDNQVQLDFIITVHYVSIL
jgi:hypothetical protein